MINSTGGKKRTLKTEKILTELVVVGGGLSGVCAAITAARQGLKVVLIQDRSVLGGNASSEVRLWILGATSHMGNNNRWSREGGVIDELLVENMYRNPEGNAVILDLILLDKVKQEPNIQLLLNTAVYELEKDGDELIKSVHAFCAQNSTQYEVHSNLFCDASGDGILGFLAGAAFRMGAEGKEEFDELMAPDAAYGELLGHTLYFYTKDTERPVSFTPPAFAMDVTKEVPRFKNFNAQEHGCKLWWVEYGGRLDTVHDTEEIKWELWKVIYGVWDYIKNSGNFPEAETLTLEWVGMIPGKRESRRFEGDYMMSQKDVVEQRTHPDAVAFGGWSIDLHPADGVFSERQPCNQWHGKGLFQIPYRSLYSHNINNLFLTGRIISVSHVAFGATRVMATCAHVGQAVGVAAAVCHQLGLKPRMLNEANNMALLQRELLKTGQHIPGVELQDTLDLVQYAQLKASSSLAFEGFAELGLQWKPIQIAAAQMLPLLAGPLPVFSLEVDVLQDTVLEVHVAASALLGNFTPECILGAKRLELKAGKQLLHLDFELSITDAQYVFLTFMRNEQVQLPYVEQRITGMLSVFNGTNKAVSNTGKQVAPEGSGVDSFEFWTPQRRPEGQNLALRLSTPLNCYAVSNICNGVDRPTTQPNAWVADPQDAQPFVELTWDKEQAIKQIELCFDTDFDHAMESVLMTHPERRMPFCVQRFRIENAQGRLVYQEDNNYQTRKLIQLEVACLTASLKVFVEHPSAQAPAAVFAIRCYN